MKYMVARFLQEADDFRYRVYTTDTLQAIAKNGGSYPSKRYAEIISRKPAETRSGDEIVADVVSRCGLVME